MPSGICYFPVSPYLYTFIRFKFRYSTPWIFGPKRDEVTGAWRRLHNEEIYDVFSSPNIIWVIKSRRMRWAGHVARVGERRGAYRVLVWTSEGWTQFSKPRHRWEGNIKK